MNRFSYDRWSLSHIRTQKLLGIVTNSSCGGGMRDKSKGILRMGLLIISLLLLTVMKK